MNLANVDACFDAQMERIKFITGKRTQAELAELFGVKRSFVAAAKRRGKVPASWLVILMQVKNVHPEWILTGNGSYSLPKRAEVDRYETGDEAAERSADEDALRRLPSHMLAGELLRRIAVAQSKAYCLNNDE